MRLIKSLYIDSENRDANETNSRFRVHLEDALECSAFFCKHISYPNTLYSFQSTRNIFWFYLFGDGVIKSVVIPTTRVFDATTFVSTFQTLLQAVNVNFTVTFDTNTGKITITNNVVQFKIANKFSDPTITNSSLIKVGFHENHLISDFVNTITAEHILKLYATRYVYLCCNIVDDLSEHSSGTINNIVARIPLINSSFGAYMTYETQSFASDLIVFQHRKFIEELQFYFINDFSELIDSTNGLETSIQLNFYD
jgi:hypothetical protein